MTTVQAILFILIAALVLINIISEILYYFMKNESVLSKLDGICANTAPFIILLIFIYLITV